MKVGIIIYQGCSMWSAMGAMELLERANKIQSYFTKSCVPNFKIDFVASEQSQVTTTFPFPIQVTCNIYQPNFFDWLIIPGFDANPDQIMQLSDELAQWINTQYNRGTKLASICTGGFILAKAGLLNGKQATTHWLAQDYFNNSFPDVNLCIDKILIDHGDILMSGGATSFQNLIVYLIEKHMGHSVAVGVSKVYLIDIYKDTQESYMTLFNPKNHGDKEICEAQNYIESNYRNKISIDEVSNVSKLTKRTFIRRFKNATKQTPLNYIQKVKVERAKQMLESERKTFEEIAFDLAYEDVNAFRKIFIKFTGISPRKYKARYKLIVNN